MKTPTGSIEIIGLRVLAKHGVSQQETIVGNTFEVSVKIDFEAEHAMRTDRVDLTLNYAEVVNIIRNEMAFPSKLLEHVVYNIYNSLQMRFPQIIGGKISVYKITPPISAEVDKIGFTFSW